MKPCGSRYIVYMIIFFSYWFYLFARSSQPAPVDKVLFLKGRATGRNLEVATLVTSEGGYIRFWCLHGAKNEMGELEKYFKNVSSK